MIEFLQWLISPRQWTNENILCFCLTFGKFALWSHFHSYSQCIYWHFRWCLVMISMIVTKN